MKITHNKLIESLFVVAIITICSGCSSPKPWPESPLYEEDVPLIDSTTLQTAADVMALVEGNYGHFDIVAYSGDTPNGPLNTFIVSYGFTRFEIEAGRLVEYDTFCFSEHKSNQNFTTKFSDEATQAIIPIPVEVDVSFDGEDWQVHRPFTPTLLGIEGDPNLPLPTEKDPSLYRDDDYDGKPGVTVDITLFGLIDAELYIARREIFSSFLNIYEDGSLRGHVVDESEQLVLGASLWFLDVPNNPEQYADPGLNPVILIPVGEDVTTCEQLQSMRDELFPPSPEF